MRSSSAADRCKEHDIPLVLGAETRLDRVDHDALVAFAEREAAFL